MTEQEAKPLDSVPVREPTALLDQQLALGAYLDALLGVAAPPQEQEAPPKPPVAEVVAAPAPVAPVETPPITQIETKRERPSPMAAPVPARVPAAVVAPKLETRAAPLVTPMPETPAVTPVPAQGESVPPTVTDARPEWARQEFQSLLFQVAGLTLAVPLAKLNGVMPWDDTAMTPMPGHSALFLGLLSRHGQQVKVVDTAQVVLPPDRLARLGGRPEERVSHLVLVGDGGWALACSAIGEVLSLGPDDVKWRTASGTRPWLAGTVVQHMCALLDVDAFVDLLREGHGTP